MNRLNQKNTHARQSLRTFSLVSWSLIIPFRRVTVPAGRAASSAGRTRDNPPGPKALSVDRRF